MAQTAYKYLKFIRFSELSNWDVKTYFGNKSQIFNPNVKIVTGKVFLNEAGSEKVKIRDTDIYNIIGVRTYGKGAYINRQSQGLDLKMRTYQKTHVNQLIWCKVDTKNGGFGIVTDQLAGSFASSNMSLSAIKIDKIAIEYLQLLFKAPRFQQYLDSLVTGTTNRKYISFTQLLEIVNFPLPPLPTQQSLVRAYQAKIDEATNCETQAKELEIKIEKYLMEELGITIETKQKQDNGYKYLQFVKFSELDRWDTWNKKQLIESSKYVMSKFKDILLAKPKYGSNSKAKKQITDTRYIRITDINEDGTLNDEVVSSEKPDNQYVLKNNDFLIARSGNTVGKTFLYDIKYGKCIYAGYLVKYSINEKIVIPKFILAYSKATPFKLWINSKQRISAQPNINGQEYLDFPLPLPPLPIQNQIVNQIDTWKTQITELKNTASNLRDSAQAEFEKALFI